MKNISVPHNKGEVVIYKAKGGKTTLEVKLQQETVWLSQQQVAELFGTQRPAITKHLNNIFKTKELEKDSVCSILEHTARDGKVYQTAFYNLDAIISVGYRVNSHRATQFRIWATRYWGAQERDFLLIMHEHLFVFRKPTSEEDIGVYKDSLQPKNGKG